MKTLSEYIRGWCLLVVTIVCCPTALIEGTPANKAGLEKHYDRFLSRNLGKCTTCHLPSNVINPQDLDEFPHNSFGQRLRALGDELKAAGQNYDIAARLKVIATEDSDGDGVPNELELLLGHNPGDKTDVPNKEELELANTRENEFRRFMASYRWQPFEAVRRPPLPRVRNAQWIRNPIDAFVAVEHESHHLIPRPETTKEILLRRVYLDLIGLNPSASELRAFENDHSPDAYEKVVDRLLDDPRYGERWGRHWMDVWRYSDWAGWSGGNQIRDSQPHIWRWRDWIVQSLNDDKPYDRMIIEMLAADEIAPENTNALPATGYLVRNFKLLSREQWLEDTVKHTAQAFLGVTVGCAKCHDHMYDPISQREYYEMRAIFEPYQVRTDRVPGQLDTNKTGLARVYDVATNPPTYLFVRGDERKPDTNQLMRPGVPVALSIGNSAADRKGLLKVESIPLPLLASFPDKRSFVIQELIQAGEQAISEAEQACAKAQRGEAKPDEELRLQLAVARARQASLISVLKVEHTEDRKESEEWAALARETLRSQRLENLAEAKLKRWKAQQLRQKTEEKLAAANEPDSKSNGKKPDLAKIQKDLEAAKKSFDEAEKTLAAAETEERADLNTSYKPRPAAEFPTNSTGRRSAFAQWITDRNNPLTARVAMNHLWLHHFGRGIVPTPADFGRNGQPASNPQLLDWLAAEFMQQNWSMKAMHRLLVESSAYRMASTTDEANAKEDPDNVHLWRMPSRRLEAEAVRDNLLYAAGNLDPAMGGPEIDHHLGLSSNRRSVYLRLAAEKEVEFLKIFDGPSVTECYQRRATVMPQQALALANSEIAFKQAQVLADAVGKETGNNDDEFIQAAFLRVLGRRPKITEVQLCHDFLTGRKASGELRPVAFKEAEGERTISRVRARENLILVLFNHNDFVTIR